MRSRFALLAVLAVLPACSGSTAATPGGGAPVAAVVGPAMDAMDQPAFPQRTGRPPALSLQELFHPTYAAPMDPSKVRTLLVTGDVIPARGVDYFATVRHDFLWPFRRTADYTKNADITYINLESPSAAMRALSGG
jgi:hypothetical protein